MTTAHSIPASLGYFVIGARDLAAWRAFAEDLVGMQAEPLGDGLALRLDQQAQRFIVEPGEEDDLRAVGWLYDTEAALEAAIAQAREQGAIPEAGSAALCRARGVERLARLVDPNGIAHELHFGPRYAPHDAPFRSRCLRGGFVAGALGAGHYVAVTADHDATARFYRETLGLRVSDYIRGEMAPGGPVLEATFLHAATGRHHSVAYAVGPTHKRVHHLMVEYTEMRDVGLAHERCLAAGVPLMMGLGQHPNDGMFSFYAVTPSGFGLEIGWGGVVVDDADWQVRSYTRLSDWGHHSPRA